MLETLANELPSGPDDVVRASAFVTGGFGAFWSVVQSFGNFVAGIGEVFYEFVLVVIDLFSEVETSFLVSLIALIIDFLLLLQAILIFAVYVLLIIPVIICAILLTALLAFS